MDVSEVKAGGGDTSHEKVVSIERLHRLKLDGLQPLHPVDMVEKSIYHTF